MNFHELTTQRPGAATNLNELLSYNSTTQKPCAAQCRMSTMQTFDVQVSKPAKRLK